MNQNNFKYRLGKKNKRAILEVETGREYLVFPQGKTEHIEAFLNFLNKDKVEIEWPTEDDIDNVDFSKSEELPKLTENEQKAAIAGFKAGAKLIIYNLRKKYKLVKKYE